MSKNLLIENLKSIKERVQHIERDIEQIIINTETGVSTVTTATADEAKAELNGLDLFVEWAFKGATLQKKKKTQLTGVLKGMDIEEPVIFDSKEAYYMASLDCIHDDAKIKLPTMPGKDVSIVMLGMLGAAVGIGPDTLVGYKEDLYPILTSK